MSFLNAINSLTELNQEFDKLMSDMDCCQECNFPDCMGFIWLLDEEIDQIYETGAEILNINNEANFIAPQNYQANLYKKYPKCSLYQNDRDCQIYDQRPFVCHSYPLGLECEDDKLYWVIHTDCLFIQNKIVENTFSHFIQTTKNLIERIQPTLMSNIASTFRKMFFLTTSTEKNNYQIVKEVKTDVQV